MVSQGSWSGLSGIKKDPCFKFTSKVDGQPPCSVEQIFISRISILEHTDQLVLFFRLEAKSHKEMFRRVVFVYHHIKRLCVHSQGHHSPIFQLLFEEGHGPRAKQESLTLLIDHEGLHLPFFLGIDVDSDISHGDLVCVDSPSEGLWYKLMLAEGMHVGRNERQLVPIDHESRDAFPVVGSDVLQGDGGLP